MKFMLILFNTEAAFGTITEEQRGAAFRASMAVNAALASEGAIASGDPVKAELHRQASPCAGPRNRRDRRALWRHAVPVRRDRCHRRVRCRNRHRLGLSCPAPAHGVVEVRPLMSLG